MEATEHLSVKAGATFRFHGTDLQLRKGSLWLTAEGDPGDYLLESGEWYHARKERGVVVEALQDSELLVADKPKAELRPVAERPSRAGLAISFAVVYLVWGSTYLAIRYAVETMPAFGMAGARFLAAGGLLTLGLVVQRKRLPKLRQILGAFFIGTLLLVGGNGGVVWAEQQGLPSGIAAMIIAATPLWMMILDRAFGRRLPLQSIKVAAGIAGLAGVAFLVFPSKNELLPAVPLVPALFVVLSSFSWSLGSILSRSVPLPESPWWTTALQMIGGGLVLAVISILRGEPSGFSVAAVSAESWAAWAYLVLFGSVLAFSCYLWILKHSTAARVSTYALVNPVVALFLGWSLGGETLSARVGLAAMIILPSVFILIMEKSKEPAASAQKAVPRESLDSSLDVS